MTTIPELDATGLMLALALPWLAGVVTVRAMLGPLRVTLLLGHGFMVGQLLIILLLLAWDSLGLRLAFAPLAWVLAALTALLVLAWRRNTPSPGPEFTVGWRDALWLLPLLAFLAERGLSLAGEVTMRPLFAWDAWMNWAPRAVVWFHEGALATFVMPEQWLAATADPAPYTLGNPRANVYPPGVPLLLLWPMLGSGTYDHNLLYLPWLLLPAAAGLALWGHLRQLCLPRAACALAVFALLSQPLANTHTALPGYADLWLAVAFGLGGMALAEWHASGQWRWGVLAALLALCCALFKVPGLAYAAILLAAAGLLLWRPPVRWVGWFLGSALALTAVGLLLGLHPDAAQFGADHLTIRLPGALPTLELAPAPLLPLLWDSFFITANWHLFWLLLFTCLVAGLWLGGYKTLHNIALVVFVCGLGVLLAVFGLTHYFRQAANGVTLDRALLYVVPLGVYVAFAQLATLWHANRAAEAR